MRKAFNVSFHMLFQFAFVISKFSTDFTRPNSIIFHKNFLDLFIKFSIDFQKIACSKISNWYSFNVLSITNSGKIIVSLLINDNVLGLDVVALYVDFYILRVDGSGILKIIIKHYNKRRIK